MNTKENKNYIKVILKYLWIPIIAPLIVAIIMSFLKINTLENKINEQNILIQGNKVELLQNFGDSVTIIKKEIQELNFKTDMLNQQNGNNNSQYNTYKK